MPKEDDFEVREAGVRAFLRTQAQRAIALRSKDREFHGLEREFLYYQAQMLLDYDRTRDLKHPRDLGDAREKILRQFLTVGGYLPKRYAVSDRSVRVISPSGHISNEIDISLYDPLDSIMLMNRQDVYEVHPIESVYGVIQIKSSLTKKELRSGLNNLASFKRLERPAVPQPAFFVYPGRPPAQRGFAILFAYVSEMSWLDIISELETFAKSNPPRLWPNAVFILDRGFFHFGTADGSRIFNGDIEAIEALRMYGLPDREGLCLYSFQHQLLDLLRNTSVSPAQLSPYFQLPLVAEKNSYIFTLGNFAEVGNCKSHGDFARKISQTSLETLIQWCEKAKSINWIKATNIAYGLEEDEEAYRRQPNEVRIYNPENLPLSEVLLEDGVFAGQPVRTLGFDSIQTAGMTIWVPRYYANKESLISACPTCAKSAKSRPQAINAKSPLKHNDTKK